MKKKDVENEYIGIISIIVIVLLAGLGVYFYLFHQPEHPIKGEITTIPVEAPSHD